MSATGYFFNMGERVVIVSAKLIAYFLFVTSVLAYSNADEYHDGYNYDILSEDCHPIDEMATRNLGDGNSTLYGFVMVTRNTPYPPNLDCSITIKAPQGYQLSVRIPSVQIYNPTSGCSVSYMEITDATDTPLKYCGYGRIPYTVYTIGNTMTVTIVTGSYEQNTDWNGFTLYYTAFHTKECKSEGKNATEFLCSSGTRCVPAFITCDDLNNCGDWTDEAVRVCGLTEGSLIAIIIVVTMVGLMAVFFIAYFIYSKRKEKSERNRRQRERQHRTVRPEPASRPTSSNSYTEPPPPYTFALDPYNELPDQDIPAFRITNVIDLNKRTDNIDSGGEAYGDNSDINSPVQNTTSDLHVESSDGRITEQPTPHHERASEFQRGSVVENVARTLRSSGRAPRRPSVRRGQVGATIPAPAGVGVHGVAAVGAVDALTPPPKDRDDIPPPLYTDIDGAAAGIDNAAFELTHDKR